MNERSNKFLESERSFKDLLGQASPRPMPSAEDTEIARSAVHAEWQAVARQTTQRRRIVSFAAAATVLIALAVVLNVVRVPTIPVVQVAAIDRSVGSIYVLGEQSQLLAMPDNASITSGQTIVTAAESGLGLTWGTGGSLRIGADSRVTFDSADAIRLESGVLYFDSAGMPQDTAFNIETVHGSVTHLGTQYMVDVHGDTIGVSVREGAVSLDGTYYAENAEQGERIEITGNARPARLNIRTHGEAWAWVEAVAPAATFHGRAAIDLIEWVARETGLGFEFADAAARNNADNRIDGVKLADDPRTALRQGLALVGLSADIHDGVIRIFSEAH